MSTQILNNGITLVVSHDYLSLKLPCGATLTTGRSSEKATGGVPVEVFRAFCQMVSTRKIRLDEAITEWAQTTLPTIWPTFGAVPGTPTLGMKVTKTLKGIKEIGEIVKLAPRKNARHHVRFPSGLYAMTSLEIETAK